MSFLLPCPNCGPRRVEEYAYGGEFQTRPSAEVSLAAWAQYLYGRRNAAGLSPCKRRSANWPARY